MARQGSKGNEYARSKDVSSAHDSGAASLVVSLLVAAAARADPWQPSAERRLFFVLPRLPEVNPDAGLVRLAGLTAVGALAAVLVTRASFFATCPVLARDFGASNPGCKAPALISTALLSPPTATGALFAIGWLLGTHQSATGIIIGGSIGTAVGLLSWVFPVSTSARTIMLPIFSALGAAAGFELSLQTRRRDDAALIVGFAGDRVTVAGVF